MKKKEKRWANREKNELQTSGDDYGKGFGGLEEEKADTGSVGECERAKKADRRRGGKIQNQESEECKTGGCREAVVQQP